MADLVFVDSNILVYAHDSNSPAKQAKAQQVVRQCWDALIVAAARLLGARTILSEDLQHGQEIEGILVQDPHSSIPLDFTSRAGVPSRQPWLSSQSQHQGEHPCWPSRARQELAALWRHHTSREPLCFQARGSGALPREAPRILRMQRPA